MNIYVIKIVSFCSDVFDDSYIFGHFSSKEKAENAILKYELYNKGYENVYIENIKVDEK